MTQFVRRRAVRRRERPAGGRVGRDLGSRASGEDAEDPENGQGDEVGQPGLEVAVEKGDLVALHKSNEVPYSVGTLLVR